MFIANGYPEKIVRKTIDASWERETFKALLSEMDEDTTPQTNKEFFDVIHAPYIQGFSENLQKKLRHWNIGFVPKKEATLFDQLCQLKPKGSRED